MNDRGRVVVGAVAGLLFAGIFVLRLAVSDPDAAILLLCAAPTALLAAEFGLRAASRPRAEPRSGRCLVGKRVTSVGAAGYVTRGVTFAMVGGLIGWFTDRRRVVEQQNTRQFELSLDLLAVAGFDGYFKRVNPAFETVLGYSAEEICSRPFLDFVHPDDRESTEAEAAKLRQRRHRHDRIPEPLPRQGRVLPLDRVDDAGGGVRAAALRGGA